MKPFRIALFATLTLAVAGCNSAAPSAETGMQNPLVAERYWSDLVDRMVEIQLHADPAQDAAAVAAADEVRRDALAKQQEASALKRNGKLGSFIAMKEATEGWALLMPTTLFLSSDFVTYPGPSLHVYLSTSVDPRDGQFPADTDTDLGLLPTPYGEQAIVLPAGFKTDAIRSVVLYDTTLKRLYGFAQI